MNEILNIDAISGLKQLESDSIDCIVTSPPYYQLRDYGNDRQIGLENSYKEYVDSLVEVFNEAKRVLKGSGTMFIVIGDTYSGSSIGMRNGSGIDVRVRDYSFRTNLNELPRKSLMQIPSRLAIALQDDGWILRNEIIWHKTNAMPQSVGDRFTHDYEKIFFFVKSRFYYFKQVKEPMKSNDLNQPRGSKGVLGNPNGGLRKPDSTKIKDYMRNKRSIWSIPTKGTKESHFATFPDELVELLVESGCPKNGVVLDPFIGSGTTAMVAKKMGLQYIGFDINQEYLDIANKRLKRTPVLFRMDI